MACWALGDDHPIAQHTLRLTERNMSYPRRRALLERQRAAEAALAEELLRSARPSAVDAASSATETRQELTPVPERIWALRNVATTLAQGSDKGRAQARKLLAQALELQRGRFGNDAHPALLGETWRCVPPAMADGKQKLLTECSTRASSSPTQAFFMWASGMHAALRARCTSTTTLWLPISRLCGLTSTIVRRCGESWPGAHLCAPMDHNCSRTRLSGS
jgi:hypothetical protein